MTAWIDVRSGDSLVAKMKPTIDRVPLARAAPCQNKPDSPDQNKPDQTNRIKTNKARPAWSSRSW